MVNLVKGQNTKLSSDAKIVKVGLSWDAASAGQSFDLDAMALGLDDKNGKAVDEDNFIYYGHLKNSNGSIQHSGDNLTGEGDGDDEVITVDLSKVDDKIQAILFFVTIYEATSRKQNFGMVKNPKARLYYSSSDTADIVYELDEDFSDKTVVEFVMLYKNNGEWKFKAVGEGINGSTTDELKKYGLK